MLRGILPGFPGFFFQKVVSQARREVYSCNKRKDSMCFKLNLLELKTADMGRLLERNIPPVELVHSKEVEVAQLAQGTRLR